VLIEAAGNAGLEEQVAAALDGQKFLHRRYLARSKAQAMDLWRIRDSISEAQKKEGASIKHDISVPVASIPAFHRKSHRRGAGQIPGIAAREFRPSGRW
jgi:FAD/FMN-containing dehydrogenase